MSGQTFLRVQSKVSGRIWAEQQSADEGQNDPAEEVLVPWETALDNR